MVRLLFNLKMAFEALFYNRLRSLLTALGIIFGVAAVIAIQALGEGGQQGILDQLKLVGVNNILITQKKVDPDKKDEARNHKEKKTSSLGLSLADAEVIRNTIPQVSFACPIVSHPVFVIVNGKGKSAMLNGVLPDLLQVQNLKIVSGSNFSALEVENAAPVCLITQELKNHLFPQGSAIGQEIKCGNAWFRVKGIIEARNIDDKAKTEFGLNDNIEVYAPISTVKLRFKNRGYISKRLVESASSGDDDEDVKGVQYNEADRLVVQVSETRYLEPVSEIVYKLLKRRHNGAEDFEIKVPEKIVKQQQETNRIMNFILTVIAGITLLVGGIGIMNIMMVSVTERKREIGVRMALGGRRKDIVFQFLAEALVLCLAGGIIGIILGVGVSAIVNNYSRFKAIITPMSMFIAYLFAIAVGLLSGIYPAWKAAQSDPVESLRYE